MGSDPQADRTDLGNTGYVVLINVSFDPRQYLDGYQPGDPMVETWRGEIEDESGTLGQMSQPVILERIYIRHNREDRPDGRIGPSLSIGDVLCVGEQSFACRMRGFEEVPTPENITTDKSWVQIMDEKRKAGR